MGDVTDHGLGLEIGIGALAERTGVAQSALRYYEDEGLIHSYRSSGNQRRYHRDIIRRVSFIRVAQELGLSLEEIRNTLSDLPERRTPTEDDWARLSAAWRPRIDEQIAMLERLRDRLDGCIGCGCLSLKYCHLLNPEDCAAASGPGPQYVYGDGDHGEDE
jgi:MerR family redox-sensitive transcriptional activator SoxR